jgi:hypothetical protein
MALQQAHPLNCEIHWEIGDSSPSRVRNNLVARFLASDCEQMLFIDSDILFSVAQVADICSKPELVVGHVYMAKQDGAAKPIFNTFPPGESPPMRADGMQKMRYMGTGFLRIKRCVFEMMINKYPEMAYQRDEAPAGTVNYSFFEERVWKFPNGFQRFLTEDWLFCQRCLDLGIDVWADVREDKLCGHRGTVVFPLNSQKAGLFGPSPAPVPAQSASLPGPTAGARQSGSADTANTEIATPLQRDTAPLEIVPRGTSLEETAK